MIIKENHLDEDKLKADQTGLNEVVKCVGKLYLSTKSQQS